MDLMVVGEIIGDLWPVILRPARGMLSGLNEANKHASPTHATKNTGRINISVEDGLEMIQRNME